MEQNWYAVYTSARAEKKVKERFDESGIENYLPLRTEIRIWSDRKKKVLFPLIPGYIFVYVSPDNFLRVLNIPGVVSFLKEKAIPVAIPDNQIRRLRMMVDYAIDEVEYCSSPIEIGDVVEVQQGELKGLTGELVEMRGKYKIVIRLQYFGCALTTIPLGWVKKQNI